MNLEEHYRNLWEQALAQFRNGEFITDPFLNSDEDKRFGITLRARITQPVKERVAQFLHELRSLEMQQYYYPPSDLHVTILSIISCYQGFSLQAVNIQEHISLIKKLLQSTEPFEITFKGITASPSTIMLQGFPQGGTLQELRENIRQAYKATELQHTIDKRYRLQTTHSTVVRFKEPVKQPDKFLKILQQYRDFDFGILQVHDLELVCNDWYHKQELVKVLANYRL